jgi:hypothetical protein
VAANAAGTIAPVWRTRPAFAAIATTSGAVRQPSPGADACGIVGSWLERPNVAVIGAGGRFREINLPQVLDAPVSGALTMAAAHAARAFEIGAAPCSTDGGCRRLLGPELRNRIRPGTEQ